MEGVVGGRLHWNDEKGFGFVVPNGGGERAFVHVSAFRLGSRRPMPGDVISYLPGMDSKGRLQAREVRHAAQSTEKELRPSRLSRRALGVVALLAAVGAAVIDVLPITVAGTYVVLSMISYLMYWSDKVAAGRGSRRTPENSLHLADVLGGWPGALIAQQQFRHKTIKQPFQAVFLVTIAINLVAAWWLVSSGLAARLSQSLAG